MYASKMQLELHISPIKTLRLYAAGYRVWQLKRKDSSELMNVPIKRKDYAVGYSEPQ